MPSTLELCTYFDHRYLSRGLALHESLRRWGRPFRLWVLCLTDECFQALEGLGFEDVVPLKLTQLESDCPELAAAKADRSRIEYYFTCTPVLMAWIFARQPEIDIVSYIDADLYFYRDPHEIIDQFAGYSTLIIPHRFSERNAGFRQWGTYNVGWVSFRCDPAGLACLAWWRMSCLAWCRDVLDGDRFADQKYLDQFPARFERVQALDHPGANLAPWNLDRHQLTCDAEGRLLVDGRPLIFFHFHGLRQVLPFLWKVTHRDYGAPLDRTMRTVLYRPYVAALKKAEKRLEPDIARGSPLDRLSGSALRQRLRLIRGALRKNGGLVV